MPQRKIRTRKTGAGRGTRYPINQGSGEITVVRAGGHRFAPFGYGVSREHPYKVVAILKDGRRFEAKVQAIDSNEAQASFNEKFPLAVIKSIHRADKIKTAREFLETAEKYFEE